MAARKLVKLDVCWEDGVFLSYRTTIVGTSKGVMRTRTVRRKPAEERGSVENLRMVGHGSAVAAGPGR